MKHKLLKVIFILGLLSPLAVCAQNWFYVGDAQNGRIVRLVDKDSIRKNGSVVKVWALTLIREYDPRMKNGNSTRQQWEYDCKRETQTMLFQTIFRDGEVVFSDNQQNKQSSPVIPGSLDSMGFDFACGKKSKAIDIGNATEAQMREAFWQVSK